MCFLVLFIACGRAPQERADVPASRDGADSTLSPQNPGEVITFEHLLDEYEDPQRGTWQNPDLVLRKLGSLQGKVVADIGAGSGYFTFPIARQAARVIAIDIEEEFLDYIEERKLELPQRLADAIETRLTNADDPNLKPNEADVVLMVNVYYYLNDRVSYMRKVRDGLSADGILALVDFKTGEMPVGPGGDKVPAEEALGDLQKAGFSVMEIDTTSLEYQYIIIAS